MRIIAPRDVVARAGRRSPRQPARPAPAALGVPPHAARARSALRARGHPARAARQRVAGRSAAGSSDWGRAPAGAVPVLNQRAAATANGPGVASGQGGHAEQGTVGQGTVHQRPGGAVPVLDDAFETERKVLVEPDGPGVAGRNSSDPAENATTWLGVGAGHTRPRRTVPLLDDGLVDVQSFLG